MLTPKAADEAKRFIKAFWTIWIVWSLICLGALVGIICVIVHFVTKYW